MGWNREGLVSDGHHLLPRSFLTRGDPNDLRPVKFFGHLQHLTACTARPGLASHTSVNETALPRTLTRPDSVTLGGRGAGGIVTTVGGPVPTIALPLKSTATQMATDAHPMPGG